MDKKLAISLLMGVIIFFVSLSLIKEKKYFVGYKEIPKSLYLEKTENLNRQYESLNSKKNMNLADHYACGLILQKLDNYRIENTNGNYPIAMITFIGSVAITYLLLLRLKI